MDICAFSYFASKGIAVTNNVSERPSPRNPRQSTWTHLFTRGQTLHAACGPQRSPRLGTEWRRHSHLSRGTQLASNSGFLRCLSVLGRQEGAIGPRRTPSAYQMIVALQAEGLTTYQHKLGDMCPSTTTFCKQALFLRLQPRTSWVNQELSKLLWTVWFGCKL